ncbi:MAG: diaminopimelate epimerase [Flavobacteriales bacterium]|nr:diaminopimelate epimerase [Flavobacteriales bacterium]
MKLKFSKYQGTGNDFIMVDNRHGLYPLSQTQIQQLCDRRFGIGADGLILLGNCNGADFEMIYHNADGHVGSMCGNGGRCVVAYARDLEIIKDDCNFMAFDGLHEAICLENSLVSLKMIDVDALKFENDAWVLDTGSPHLVSFKEEVREINVKEEGAKLRNSPAYVEHGINVNFVSIQSEELSLRTYERGVEDETLACGTGATASAIAAFEAGLIASESVKVNVLGGQLEVKFKKNNTAYHDIHLKGPAEFVFRGEVDV